MDLAARFIARGDLSPDELVRSVLERIDRINPRLEAYVSVFHDDALAEARRATDELVAHGSRGPLHGIPVAIKDLYDVRGKPTLAGSRVREGHVAAADSEVVSRLRRAGAIIVGKTVTHEFASGVTSPPARNPWNLDRVPGGSSGGSGAAVAADLCMAATGTDTAGSIRIPASVNGVVGLKPTFGRVSKRGVVPLAWSLDHAGPLAKTVFDAALMLEAIAGHDPTDPSSSEEQVTDYAGTLSRGVDGLRVAIVRNWYFDRVNASVAEAIEEAASVFEDLGARVDELRVPHLELSMPIHHTILASEASAYHQPTLRAVPDRYRRGTRMFLEAGELVPATAYVNAQRARELVRQGFREAFSDTDVIIAPSLPTTAGAFGSSKVQIDGAEDITQAYVRLSVPANLAGLPTLSVPCGFHDGLPIGLQIIGKPFEEQTVLRAGHAYERAAGHYMRRPPIG
ncbi:MAG: amidase family protein [Actinomycetota bacterium]|nr:amidase family protein [Actinomycetota bacterium]